jgi:type IV pilus assembly protein PilA
MPLECSRGRPDPGKEAGFTLIELMVVVLIIAILLAIAIPTFLGARTRAEDRAAQVSLRNALTAAKTAYTDTSNYSEAYNLASLQALEPSLSFSGGAVSGVNQISVSSGGDSASQAIVLATLSASGTCWFILDAATGSSLIPGTVPGAGTWYGNTPGASSCIATATPSSGWVSHF